MRDPERFEVLLEPLHESFIRAAHIMEDIGPSGKNYWDILKAAFSLLESMSHLENASFEWRSYSECLDEEVGA